ncbi:hypothetical protein HPB49_011829 [Dermacentor silvarum]|uniref:Uncharacterized protein n=1 Tax=Dermacentor silvarum TaxID=543639 RepID=A0ACB8CKS9_DERSI|nr:hypothetical protein HPB49_011829 [Dermacentor silvarum]
MQARHAQTGADATRRVTSVDLQYHYAYVPFPPRRILYENRVAFGNEMNWSHPGGLVGKKYDKQPLWEAKEKKYADGFDAVYTENSKKEMKMAVFPRFKTVQTYSVACYSAFNDSIENN